MLFNVLKCLEGFPKEMGRMCGNFVMCPLKTKGSKSEACLQREISSCIDSIILLRDVLRNLTSLAESLEPCRLLQMNMDCLAHQVTFVVPLLKKIPRMYPRVLISLHASDTCKKYNEEQIKP